MAVSQRYHAIYCFSYSINDSVPLKTFQSPIKNLHNRLSVSTVRLQWHIVLTH